MTCPFPDMLMRDYLAVPASGSYLLPQGEKAFFHIRFYTKTR